MSTSLINPKQMAEVLNVPVSWIYQRTRKGTSAIPHIKMGKYVRFNADEVLTFLQQKDNCRRVK